MGRSPAILNETYSFSESGELLGLAPAEDVEAVDEGGE